MVGYFLDSPRIAEVWGDRMNRGFLDATWESSHLFFSLGEI